MASRKIQSITIISTNNWAETITEINEGISKKALMGHAIAQAISNRISNRRGGG
jgi:hypothetical protein